MEGTIERVEAVLNGQMPDRVPLFDLIRNDAILSHFAGETITVENGQELVYRAFGKAVDATRDWVRPPTEEKVVKLEDGREQRFFRWTQWTAHIHYPDSDAYAAEKKKLLKDFRPDWDTEKQGNLDGMLADMAVRKRRLGDCFLFPRFPGLNVAQLYEEVGLEDFCYYLADCPDIIDELLECHLIDELAMINHLPEAHGLSAVFIADDLAYKSGPLLTPGWLRKHYFPRFGRILAAYHAKGIKVLYHSDGDINPVLDDLVAAGIDGLNPIEVLANMDVRDIHRRYPGIFMAGGIDVSRLLPFGPPGEVKDAVKSALDAAEGRIMIGSTTELHDEVPLENFLAMREAVLEYRY